MKIDTIRYVFENKQPELKRLVVKYGLTPATSGQDLWRKVNYLVKTFGKEFLKEIALIHPDRELIIWSEHPNTIEPNNESSDVKSTPITPQTANISIPASKNPIAMPTDVHKKVDAKSACQYSSVCGCAGADGNYSECAGNPDCPCNIGKEKVSGADGKSLGDTLKENLPLVIVGSLLLVGGLIFLGNRRLIQ